MGGPGSTRWRWHNRKTQVEECLSLHIKTIKKNLKPGYLGSVYWSIGERVTDTISYRVGGDETPTFVRFMYTQTNRYSSEETDIDYKVSLQTTPLPWGGVRYWFTCPLIVNGRPCMRRVGVLHIPPGGQYFGCRHCYDLTYRSCQESGMYDGMFASLAASMWDEYPGITGKDVRAMLEGKYSENLERITLEKFIREWEPPPNPHADYLTDKELSQKSGLSQTDLSRLEEVRLLVPDHDGRYRPKLVGWAKKLDYLLSKGWELGEIKRWAKGRFQTNDPKQWPPERVFWREPITEVSLRKSNSEH